MKHTLQYLIMALLPLSTVFGQNLIYNPDFTNSGEDWGKFGNTDFNNFFGKDHASFFADNLANSGGVFQTGISGTAGTSYEFSLPSVSIEANWAADFIIAIEFYQVDDSTLISDESMILDVSAILGQSMVPGGSISATAPSGTAFVRPVIRFDNVSSVSGSLDNGFVFETSLTQVPEPSAYVCIFGIVVLALVHIRSRKQIV